MCMLCVCVCVCVRVCFSMITAGEKNLPEIMKNIFAWLVEGGREGGREDESLLAYLHLPQLRVGRLAECTQPPLVWTASQLPQRLN